MREFYISSLNLSLTGRRVIGLCQTKLGDADSFSMREYAELARGTEKSAYQAIKAAIPELRSTGLFKEVSLKPGTKRLWFEFSKDVEVLPLETVETCFLFRRKYSWTLYAILLSLGERGSRDFTLKELRYIFGEFTIGHWSFKEIKKKLVGPAAEELKKLKIAKVSMETIWDGREEAGGEIVIKT